MNNFIYVPPGESPDIRNNWMAVRQLLESAAKVSEITVQIVKGMTGPNINDILKRVKKLLPDIEKWEKQIKNLRSLILKLKNDFDNFEADIDDEMSLIDAFSLVPEISTGPDSGGPPASLHVRSGDTPSIQLEQDTSQSNPAQTWYIKSNSQDFRIEDTGAGTVPIKVEAGAPDNSFFISKDGKVGLGTSAPEYGLHYLKTGVNAEFLMERSGGARAQMGAALYLAYVGSRTDHEFRFQVASDWRMRLNPTSNSTILEMTDGGYYDGTWHDSSSREVKENIQNLTVDEAMIALKGLNPVKFHYKTNKNDEHVGFIAEDVPDLVATQNRKALSAMDVVAVLTKVVKEQQKQIEFLKTLVT
jgi:hypothetical protein